MFHILILAQAVSRDSAQMFSSSHLSGCGARLMDKVLTVQPEPGSQHDHKMLSMAVLGGREGSLELPGGNLV